MPSNTLREAIASLFVFIHSYDELVSHILAFDLKLIYKKKPLKSNLKVF
ncbi:MAG: hypothetical protein IJG31_02085 [Fusobacterium sp.]|nr:hypothetical protein [Fusobacterium sp.]